MLFREVMGVYSENHTKPINKLYMQNSELIIKASVIYRVSLKGLRTYKMTEKTKFGILRNTCTNHVQRRGVPPIILQF
jgi:hypothetical protein